LHFFPSVEFTPVQNRLLELMENYESFTSKQQTTTKESQNISFRSQVFFDLKDFQEDINSQNDSNLSLLNDYFADKNVNISIFENQKYAKLRDIFIDLNSEIPSNASVERLFSTAKKVWTCDRSKIGDKILVEMIFLKCNSQIDC
jgi:hypothetical protein